jgi:hypothetical protein
LFSKNHLVTLIGTPFLDYSPIRHFLGLRTPTKKGGFFSLLGKTFVKIFFVWRNFLDFLRPKWQIIDERMERIGPATKKGFSTTMQKFFELRGFLVARDALQLLLFF